MKRLARRAHALSDLLGDDHDLAVLLEWARGHHEPTPEEEPAARETAGLRPCSPAAPSVPSRAPAPPPEPLAEADREGLDADAEPFDDPDLHEIIHGQRRLDARAVDRLLARVGIAGLRPVAEEEAQVDQRIAERAHLPVEDGDQPIRLGGIEHQVVQLEIAVHDPAVVQEAQRIERAVDEIRAELGL